MENPKQKRKIKTELISFGDKSDENNSTNNNEIIYREIINNSSMISNKLLFFSVENFFSSKLGISNSK